MKINVPAKVLNLEIASSSGIEIWPFDDGHGDPFWAGGSSPKDYKWRLVGTVTAQIHGSHLTREPEEFNGLDIFAGDYISGTTTGSALKIIAVEAKTETSFTIIVEDVFRYNTFKSQIGNGMFTVPGSAVLYQTNEDGDPILDPLPTGLVSIDFFANLRSRFSAFRLQENFELDQPAHGFVKGNPISIDPITREFEVSDDNSFDRLIGTVSAVGPGPDKFLLKPTTKVVERFVPALPGLKGDFIYADPSNSGTYTTTESGREMFLQLSNAVESSTSSSINTPTLIIGDQLAINGVSTITLTGTTIASLVSDINLETATHNVTAEEISGATSSTTNAPDVALGLVLAFVDAPGPASATINGQLVVFNDSTDGQANFAQPISLDSDMARTINAASIPNITATAVGGGASLTIANSTGGAITIINVNPDRDGTPFAGPASCTGLPLTTPASTDSLLRLFDSSGGGIILQNITGTPTIDLGIVSVDNGRLPLGLIIEQGIRKGDMFVVSDIIARDALQVLIGDQAMVLNKGDGDWGMYLYDGSVWMVVSTQESARVDSRTLSVIVDFDSSTSTTLGEVNGGVRVSLVTVEVITPFDGTPTMSVGDAGDVSRLMADANIDLSSVGNYMATPSFQYVGPADTDIFTLYTAGGATTGQARVTITYS